MRLKCGFIALFTPQNLNPNLTFLSKGFVKIKIPGKRPAGDFE